MATRGSGGSAGSGGPYDPRYDPAFQRGFDTAGGEAGGRTARLPAGPPAGSARPAGGRAGGPAEGRPPAAPAEPTAAEPGESSWYAGTGSASATVEPASPSPGGPGSPGAAPDPVTGPEADTAAEERAAAARAHAHRMWTAYTVALSALSAACMAFGVVLVTRAYGVFNSTTVDSRDDIYWAQLGGQFGPWVFVVGLATGIGVIFLHAARWRPPPD